MKKSHIIALILIAASIGLMVTIIGDVSRYVTFSTAEQVENKEVHIIGELVRDRDMVYNPVENPNYFSFFLKDENGEIRKVVYKDAKPRDFERSEKIVLTGKMTGEEFHASDILIKCPSKYINDELDIEEVKASSS